ncbi:AAA family ATPase [Candidatus Contubernalis alkaliaceticus]|uniref:AAA family ATPase n=1 Tax=Candidatus Contubernalis alkaliaceticus TaxID=338645 RepID=UPI001F4C2ABF|nr:AAA family ATPase [Candidatus Contubernalis alkalaceticus]UNC92388.1 AAA family ATPase [Candidatus Contubernalis alkalaceticus]
MIIRKLELNGFGKFRNKEIQLSDGLNVIYGPNEAGKSTMQKFVEGMFFGFKKPYKSRRVFTYELLAYQPWEGEQYQGALEFENQGKVYRIDRNFKEDDVIIGNAQTGEILNKKFKQHKGTKEFNLAETHMNLNRNIFSNTISISQGDCISDEELTQEICSKLTNLSYSGSANISIRKASMELERVLKEEVGSEKVLKSPLGQLTRQIQQLEEEKGRLETMVNSIRSYELQLAETRPIIMESIEKKRKKEEETKRLKDSLLAKKLKNIREQEKKIKKINSIIYELEKYRYFPIQQRERVVELKEGIKNVENNLKEINESLKKQKQLVKQPRKYIEKNAHFQDLDFEAASLISRDYALYKSFNDQLIQKKNFMEKTKESLNEIYEELSKEFWKKCGNKDLYEAEKLEDSINSLKNSSLKSKIDLLEEKKNILENQLKGSKNLLLFVLSLVGVILVPTVMLNHLFAFMMTVPFLLSVNVFKQRNQLDQDLQKITNEMQELIEQDCDEQENIEDMHKKLDKILKRNQVQNPRDLRLKISQYGVLLTEKDRLEKDLKVVNREIKDLSQRYREFENDITHMLEKASLWRKGEEITELKIEEFKNRLSDYQSTFNMLMNSEEKIVELEKASNKYEVEMFNLQEESEYIFISAGVKCFEEYFEGCRRHREVEILLEQRLKYEEVLNALLEGTSLQELRKVDLSLIDSQEVQSEVSEAQIKMKQRELEKINEELTRIKSRHAELEAKIEATVKDYRPLTEVEEQLSIKIMERDNLREQGDALRAAIKMIEIVAKEIHRDFAPKLNEKVSSLISKITNNRYQQVKISKEMDITVMAPETGKHVSIHDLSGGTIDQFYFSVRVMIADLVTGNNSLPLILDDCFVQYDRKRLNEVLKCLIELSKKRQVIFFTCHSREIDMLREIKGKFKLIDLEEPKLLFLDRLHKKTEKA